MPLFCNAFPLAWLLPCLVTFLARLLHRDFIPEFCSARAFRPARLEFVLDREFQHAEFRTRRRYACGIRQVADCLFQKASDRSALFLRHLPGPIRRVRCVASILSAARKQSTSRVTDFSRGAAFQGAGPILTCGVDYKDSPHVRTVRRPEPPAYRQGGGPAPHPSRD